MAALTDALELGECRHSSCTPDMRNRPYDSRTSAKLVLLVCFWFYAPSRCAQTAGRKARMEDRHVVAALDPEHGVATDRAAVTVQEAVSLAAVFDGHAGDATATYAARHIPQLLHSALSGRHCSSNGECGLLQRTAVVWGAMGLVASLRSALPLLTLSPA
jgi:hypothetical protein